MCTFIYIQKKRAYFRCQKKKKKKKKKRKKGEVSTLACINIKNVSFNCPLMVHSFV